MNLDIIRYNYLLPCGLNVSLLEFIAFDPIGISLNSSDEEILRFCGKNTSMRKKIKEQSSKHFDVKIVRDIVKTRAERRGHQAKMSRQFYEKVSPYVVRAD
ncbi:hypothetical protein [Bartonella australis]|uniref:hypothetical protein n=1 Tax=Bartonella australis TaxID=388640 RepID=UPI00034D00DC|nr:hypothetical protein [Bartonella australis]